MSESLIKLETSRIFKFLGVSKKAEAIAAGTKYLELSPPPPRSRPFTRLFSYFGQLLAMLDTNGFVRVRHSPGLP